MNKDNKKVKVKFNKSLLNDEELAQYKSITKKYYIYFILTFLLCASAFACFELNNFIPGLKHAYEIILEFISLISAIGVGASFMKLIEYNKRLKDIKDINSNKDSFNKDNNK